MAKPTRPPLTAEFVRSVFDYDIDTGVLRWKFRADRPKKWNSFHVGKEAGSKVKGYVQIQMKFEDIGKKINYYNHQIVWLWINGEWPDKAIDHINRIRDDNRICNLRIATETENCCNKSKQKNNVSGYTGVWFQKQNQKWEAKISRNGRIVWRKHFNTKAEAVIARQSQLKICHNEFAVKD